MRNVLADRFGKDPSRNGRTEPLADVLANQLDGDLSSLETRKYVSVLSNVLANRLEEDLVSLAWMDVLAMGRSCFGL